MSFLQIGLMYYFKLIINSMTMFSTKSRKYVTLVSASATNSFRNWSKYPFDLSSWIIFSTTSGSAGLSLEEPAVILALNLLNHRNLFHLFCETLFDQNRKSLLFGFLTHFYKFQASDNYHKINIKKNQGTALCQCILFRLKSYSLFIFTWCTAN